MIIIWTIQHQDVLNELNKSGVYRVCNNNIMWEPTDTDALIAYKWICQEMRIKISTPPDGVTYPVWAWYSWEGKHKKPDMRRSGYANKGTPLVRITLDIPEQKVLLSDFDLWHFALNHWYLPVSEDDENFFMNAEDTQKETHILKSWQNIFNLSSEDDGYIYGKNNEKSIQATFWELKSEYIVSIEKFIAK